MKHFPCVVISPKKCFIIAWVGISPKKCFIIACVGISPKKMFYNCKYQLSSQRFFQRYFWSIWLAIKTRSPKYEFKFQFKIWLFKIRNKIQSRDRHNNNQRPISIEWIKKWIIRSIEKWLDKKFNFCFI